MTHDELLAKLWDDYANFDHSDYPTEHIQALRAVVELHKPTKEEIYGAYNCEECRKGNADRWIQYPCSTIQAIEKELN